MPEVDPHLKDFAGLENLSKKAHQSRANGSQTTPNPNQHKWAQAWIRKPLFFKQPQIVHLQFSV